MAAPLTANGPFLDLGFTSVELTPMKDGHLGFNIGERPRNDVKQWIAGEIDPAGRGVVIGTIELVPRVLNPYGGCEQIGDRRGEIPEEFARDEWKKAVDKGRERWAGVVAAKPQDEGAPQAVVTAERQNELIYALVLLANEALNLGVGPVNPLRYVSHQHVSSVDGGTVRVYGGTIHPWGGEGVTYPVSEGPVEPLLALLGISNASFVQHLIEQFGHRLGISRLVSVTVERMGLDVRWNFA